jgi:hypothetical protein
MLDHSHRELVRHSLTHYFHLAFGTKFALAEAVQKLVADEFFAFGSNCSLQRSIETLEKRQVMDGRAILKVEESRLFSFSRSSFGKFPQFIALHLSGCGFGQLGQKLHPMRAFEDRQSSEHKLLQFAGKLRTAIRAIAQHHPGHRLR